MEGGRVIGTNDLYIGGSNQRFGLERLSPLEWISFMPVLWFLYQMNGNKGITAPGNS